MKRREITILGSALAAVIVVFWLVFFALPPLAVPSNIAKTRTERAKLRNDFRSTETQFLGGLALAAGLIFTWRTLRLNREGQLTDRFSKAIDQLGDDKLDVRLGGIYALERIARDSPRDRGAVLEVLTAYVRRYRRTASDPRERAPFDVQAIITVLGRRETQQEGEDRLDLRGADLSYVLIEGADLSSAFMANVDLRLAQIVDTSLRHANLLNVNAEGATVTGVDLSYALLLGADLRVNFVESLPDWTLDHVISGAGTKWPARVDVAPSVGAQSDTERS